MPKVHPAPIVLASQRDLERAAAQLRHEVIL